MEMEISVFEIYDGSGSKPVPIKMGISPIGQLADLTFRNDTMT